MRDKKQLVAELEMTPDKETGDFLWGIMQEGWHAGMTRAQEIADEHEPSGELGISEAINEAISEGPS